MEIKKTTFEDAPKVTFNLDGKIMFTSQKFELVHLSLKPGEKIEKHSQPFDALFFILDGEGILETDDEKIAGTKNTAIFVPAGMQRGWRNSGGSECKILVYKDLE